MDNGIPIVDDLVIELKQYLSVNIEMMRVSFGAFGRVVVLMRDSACADNPIL